MLQNVAESLCLPSVYKCTKPWAWTLAQHKTTFGPITERWGQEGQKLKVILSYLTNLRTAWATCEVCEHVQQTEELGFKARHGGRE